MSRVRPGRGELPGFAAAVGGWAAADRAGLSVWECSAERGNGLRWDLDSIVAGLDEGLRKCAAIADEGIRSIAVDGWAVDYVRLDADGKPLADPFCYRDERAVVAERRLHEQIPAGAAAGAYRRSVDSHQYGVSAVCG